LETEAVSTLLWKFSIPAVAGMVVGALYNVVDGVFVGRGVGEDALTAVTVAFPVMTVLMAVGMLVGIGAGAMVSISLGRRDVERAEMILGNAVTLMVVLVAATVGGAMLFLDTLLIDVLGVTPNVLPLTREFMSIILLGSIFLHVGFGLNNLIRAQGDPKTALATQLISVLVNIVLNYFFVFVFKWGIAGSAFGTVCAQATAATWVMWYLTSPRAVLRLRARRLVPRLDIVRDIFKIGMAPFVMQLGASAVMVVLNRRVALFGGDQAVAAFGVVNRVMMLVMMPVVGISQGAQPIIGYNFGAERFDRVKRVLGIALGVSTLLCLVGFLAVRIGAESIIALFAPGSDLILLGAEGMRLFLLALPVVGFQIIGANYFQAIGKAGYSMLFSLSRQVIVLIPAVYLLSSRWGLEGVWLAGPTSDLASAILIGVFLLIDVRRYPKRAPALS